MVNCHVPRIAEFLQAPCRRAVPQIGQPDKNHGFTLYGMDYKEEIGRRIRKSRDLAGLTLTEVARKTGDLLTLKRINAYENGDRMPGPAEGVTLGKALGVRPSYLLAVDDTQTPITQQEESLVRNWRTLNERDRMATFRQIETMAMTNRDPVPNARVEKHLPAPHKEPAKK